MPSLFEYATEWSEKSLLHKYSTLRKQFNEQIKRLGAKVNDPRIEKFKKGGYKEQKTIRDIENLRGRKNWSEKARREDWALRITELEQLLKVRTYSLSGRAKIRSDTIKSLQEKGLKSVNNNNFDRFVSFMNWAKAMGILKEFDSEKVVEAFDQWISGGVVEDDALAAYIDEWAANEGSVDLFAE